MIFLSLLLVNPPTLAPSGGDGIVAGVKQVLLFTLLLAFTASAFEFTGVVVGNTSPLSCARRTKNGPCPVLENGVKKGRWPCEVSIGSELIQTVKPDQNQTRGGLVIQSLNITP